MKTLLITYFIIAVLNLILKAYYLSAKSYPRTETIKPWQDVAGLFIAFGFGIWVSVLLYMNF